MSNIERFENLKQIVKIVQPQFDEMAKIHGAVNYKKEAAFALQIISNNQFLADTAMGDQDSFKNAIINVAAIGLSLNPIKKLAYLIPRKKKVVLDISYLGYIQLALEVGAVKWVAAEVVREKDTFTLKGLGKEPIHEFSPFGERGEIVGAYCVAKTHDGEFIVTHMTADEILSIRDRSESYKSGKNSPWETDTTEMIKKTVIRRAAKSWPMINTRSKERFEQAIDVSNDFDPTLALPAPEPEFPDEPKPEIKFDTLRSLLKVIDRDEPKFIEHLVRVNRRDIKKLEDLTPMETDKALIMLNQLATNKKAKEQKNEVAK